MASSYLSLTIEDGESRNWTELPRELTSSILQHLGAIDILENAQKVCKSWRRLCKDPSMWRRIDLSRHRIISSFDYNWKCRHAVDRSKGGVVEIRNMNNLDESHFNYIVNRSSNLRSLGFATSMDMESEVLVEALAKLPLLEELEVSPSYYKFDLKAIGQSCPQLKTLKLNCSDYWPCSKWEDDDFALEIAESMPELRHLQLIGNRLTDTGLNAILDNLHHLKHLDLRRCFNIKLVGDLEKRCLEKIKELRRPHDSIADYPFSFLFANSEPDDEYDDYINHDGLSMVIIHRTSY